MICVNDPVNFLPAAKFLNLGVCNLITQELAGDSIGT